MQLYKIYAIYEHKNDICIYNIKKVSHKVYKTKLFVGMLNFKYAVLSNCYK